MVGLFCAPADRKLFVTFLKFLLLLKNLRIILTPMKKTEKKNPYTETVNEPLIKAKAAMLEIRSFDLCKMVGLTYPTYLNVLAGKTQVKLRHARAFSNVLKTPIDELFPVGK